MGPGVRFVASAALASLALAVVVPFTPQASGAADVPTHHVRGSVTVEPGGYVEDIYLHLTDAEGYTIGEATVSGADGTFDMEEVEDGGPYTLSMSAEPDYDWRRQYYLDTYFRSEAAPITVAGADVDLQPMQLHRMHEVHGTVVADGHPVTWMRVTAYPAGPGVTTYSSGLSTTTDEEDGTYSLMLPPGVWKIRFDGVSNDLDNDLVERWAPEWYDDVSSFAEAAPVAVPAVAEPVRRPCRGAARSPERSRMPPQDCRSGRSTSRSSTPTTASAAPLSRATTAATRSGCSPAVLTRSRWRTSRHTRSPRSTGTTQRPALRPLRCRSTPTGRPVASMCPWTPSHRPTRPR